MTAKNRVLVALSGGVDSTTVAALIHKAIGPNLICMFIDQGFMRKNEAKKINDLFTQKFSINFLNINAAQRFFDKLKGVTDPEQKRTIIGHTFIEIFEKKVKELIDELEKLRKDAGRKLRKDIVPRLEQELDKLKEWLRDFRMDEKDQPRTRKT